MTPGRDEPTAGGADGDASSIAPWAYYRTYTPTEAAGELVARGVPADQAPVLVDRYIDAMTWDRGWSPQDQWQLDDGDLTLMTRPSTTARPRASAAADSDPSRFDAVDGDAVDGDAVARARIAAAAIPPAADPAARDRADTAAGVDSTDPDVVLGNHHRDASGDGDRGDIDGAGRADGLALGSYW